MSCEHLYDGNTSCRGCESFLPVNKCVEKLCPSSITPEKCKSCMCVKGIFPKSVVNKNHSHHCKKKEK